MKTRAAVAFARATRKALAVETSRGGLRWSVRLGRVVYREFAPNYFRGETLTGSPLGLKGRFAAQAVGDSNARPLRSSPHEVRSVG
jgi:hypothetical protein